MTRRVVHVIGAGLAGLAAAVALAERGIQPIVHEAARQAGGRCRSYLDPVLGLLIDNGNHLLLSGNHAARDFLRRIGSENELSGPDHAEFAFADLSTKERWSLRLDDGRVPTWMFSSRRRVPGTRWHDYLALVRLLGLREDRLLGAVLRQDSVLYERLWRPFFLAALNTAPEEGSAKLAAAIVRETLMAGGRACRPLIATRGLSRAFIEPALTYLMRHGGQIHLDHRLQGLDLAEGRVAALAFADGTVALGKADQVVLAVPAWIAEDLVPDLTVPTDFRAIVNAHFKIVPPPGLPPIQGLVNATAEWVFAFDDRLSVTISAADRLLEVSREELAQRIWADVAEVTQIANPLPPWQIIKEKRATFAATLVENARRPGAKTAYTNLVLAGDFTATGLPATIEGAIRSGFRAAGLIG